MVLDQKLFSGPKNVRNMNLLDHAVGHVTVCYMQYALCTSTDIGWPLFL